MKRFIYLTWAWIIILGALMITTGGVVCIACGVALNKVIGVISVALGIAGFALNQRAAQQ